MIGRDLSKTAAVSCRVPRSQTRVPSALRRWLAQQPFEFDLPVTASKSAGGIKQPKKGKLCFSKLRINFVCKYTAQLRARGSYLLRLPGGKQLPLNLFSRLRRDSPQMPALLHASRNPLSRKARFHKLLTNASSVECRAARVHSAGILPPSTGLRQLTGE